MAFADNLRQLRRTRHLKQSELAAKIVPPCSQRAISHWEQGIRIPNLTTLSRLAAALDVSLEALISDVPVELPAAEEMAHA